MEKIGPRVAVLGTRGFPGIQGGVERHCEELFARLAGLGCSVRVYTRKPYSSRTGMFKDVELYPLWTPKRKSLEAIVHTFLGVLHVAAYRKDFDILHVHAIGPSLMVPVARLLRLKVVVTNHGPDYDRQKWGRLAKLALGLGEIFGTRFSNEVIAVSRVIKKSLEGRFKRKVHYIPNGVEPPLLAKPGPYLRSLGVTPRKYILTVARLVPEKGVHDLIDAFKGVKTDWRLVIAGDADHEDNYSRMLKKSALEDERIVMAGMVKKDRLSELYSNAGLFVLPSYHEGLPLVLLEALSYGLRALCSSIPANREIIRDEDCLFAPGDLDALKQFFLRDCISKPDCAIHINGADEKMKEFDWDLIALKTFDLYLNILGERRCCGKRRVFSYGR